MTQDEMIADFARLRAEKRAAVLEAAVEEAQEVGYQWITRSGVAARLGWSTGAVSRHFSPFVELKREVMREAVKRGILPIIAQGLAEQSPIAHSAEPELKRQALAPLA